MNPIIFRLQMQGGGICNSEIFFIHLMRNFRMLTKGFSIYTHEKYMSTSRRSIWTT
jgi:hypothetical protein